MSEKRRPISLQSSRTRQRLPTLAEVLARRTLPPVDLYCFYLYLQREAAEDALDFWLDVQQHENLCRAYFKDLRKSGKSVKDDWPQYYAEALERGSIYNKINGISIEQGDTRRGPDASWDRQSRVESPEANYSTLSHAPNPVPPAAGGSGAPLTAPRFPGDPDYLAQQTRAERKSILAKRGSVAPTVISRSAAITRTDLIASAERIYARYLLPGSEKEIYLPAPLRINSFPISSSTLPHPQDAEQQRALARIPDMFHSQKEYVFRTMEADVFPRFLRAKAFGNLTPISVLVRLSLGLLALWAALATAFSFIFLDVNRAKRCWVILPFSVAVMLLMSHQYELDPILVFLSQSETTPFRLIRIREPYVHRLLLQRSLGVLLLIALITAALTALFVFVPGHRL
ncbi:related to RAX1 - Protein involved in determination of budding patterns [Melanopsichium pennsylvanicum]|uniref:Related to RAX1 - Protein involved in determination of budding patterns n=2 Tax=Melanopsichium pennsylvanicum TaxID=63383 RepID=A0AAJ4XJM6_9BASI|nr:related to RAX1-Protein involved in determination of budding patterns [Melanopsichium pennsylvanicum 4]SNX82328.1 related to RAX1 - Protein involved in determination of budding patterns [Melanopsichium pennsylvanicum]